MPRAPRWIVFSRFCIALAASVPASAHADSVHLIDDALNAAAGEPASATAACTLTPGTMRTVAYIWTPPEQLTAVAWKIPAASCIACAAGSGLSLTNVSFGVRWLGACSAQAQVLIVGASGTSGCLAPDTTQVLCGPTTYTISSPSASLQLHSLPIPDGCCISGDAFLLVRFSGFGQCSSLSTGPGLAASTGSCVSCAQYVTAAGIYPTMTEWCSAGAGSPMWFSIAADCCMATPTQRHSWGRLKMMYR